ncbi:MAG: dihydropteroate synthase [Rhodocyclaceae bacterium]|nr:dihydropteroate synthase [Rhodocyclaceae bacterium]
MRELLCGRFRLGLDRPRIMAILNLTPDSFSGDGHHCDHAEALRHAEQCIAEGADILDLGGESSRPGAEPVSVQEELDRVIPVVESLKDCGVPLSVDTVKPAVMAAAIQAGASMINDINGLRDPEALSVVAGSNVGLCVMHMQGEPRTMQQEPRYEDVVAEVEQFLGRQLDRLHNAGIEKARITVDPGFGFGKRRGHNEALFRDIGRLSALAPVLVGVSRKSVLGAVTGRDVKDRVLPSVVSAVLAVQKGAAILRVHDVADTRDALRLLEAFG